MNAKVIQENLDLAQIMLGQWLRYRQFFMKGISAEEITPDEEAQFLETTSGLAQNVRKLGQRLDEKKFPFRGSEISTQLKSSISIAHFRSMPEPDKRVAYRQWHTSLVYLSRTVGALKFMNEGYVPPMLRAGKGKGKGKKGTGKPVAIWIAVVVVAAVAGFFIVTQVL